MKGPVSIRALLLIVFAASLAACGSGLAAAPPSVSPAPSAPTAIPVTSAALLSPSATAAGRTVFDTAKIASSFDVPMTIDVPDGWRPLTAVREVLTMVYVGSPPGPQSQWWGPDIAVVDSARVVDPARILKPAVPGDKAVPWPADFVGYLTSVPGVKIADGPEPITIGGATGTRLILDTPAMHPVIWLKGDTTWMGGGATGLDPALRRLVILLDVGPKRVFFQFAESPTLFAKRLPAVESLIASMRFGTD